jgi:ATP-dependent DNA helicase RecG
MNINQIKTLIKQGESSSLEFKTSTSQLKASFETVCAFLNDKGGVVLIGVKDNGKIIGQHVTDNTQREIAREIKKIEPPVQGQVEIHFAPIENEKIVIVLEVHSGMHAPYTYDSRPYSRIQSSTTTMYQHLYEQLLVRRGQLNHSWEKQPALEYDMQELDHEEILRTIKEGVDHNRISAEVLNYDIEHILNNLKLFRNNVLTKLGDFIDNQRVYGNAFRLISAATEFAQRHLPIASFFEEGKMQRIDQPAVHPLALREALINAISHRNYANRGTSIALAIYDDRLEIWNNGELPSELKIDDLRKPHQSYPRNEEIATIFYKRGWVEGWGTGTLRMIKYCQKNGAPEPEFQEYSSGFAVIFRFKEPMGGMSREVLDSATTYPLSSRQEELLKILSSGEKMTVNAIVTNLKEIPAPRTLREDLHHLKSIGLIGLEGRAKTSMWFIII